MTSSSIPHIAIIVASNRTKRFADLPLAWITDRLAARSDLSVEILDLREHPLPFYDLPTSPAAAQRQYDSPQARVVGELLDRSDGFLVLTHEFNHGYGAPLKNMLDHYFDEFGHKPMAFVGYGNVGGARAVEQLRLVAAELNMVSVRYASHIVGPQVAAIRSGGEAAEAAFASLDPRFTQTIDDLLWWARALRQARIEDQAEDEDDLAS